MRLPELRRPVSRERFEAELADLWARTGRQGSYQVRWPAHMNRRHARSPRSYAEVRPGHRPEFAFAEAARRLPRKHRRALQAHEIGHVLDPTGGEDDADLAAYEVLDIAIAYDKRWPGRGLQVVTHGPPAALLRQNPQDRFVLALDGHQRPGGGNPPGCPSGAEQFPDRFCPPRGELAFMPDPQLWKAAVCRARVLLAMDQVGGALDLRQIAAESGCSLSAVRNALRDFQELYPRTVFARSAGMRGQAPLYEITEAGMDLADWIRYRSGVVPEVEAAEFDPAALAEPEFVDPWDWTQRGEVALHYTVEEPTQEWQPTTVLAWTEGEDRPIGVLELWPSGYEVWDERSYGGLEPTQYSPLSRMRVHPAYRQLGIETDLVLHAAREAEHRWGLPVASPDLRTPDEAAWWACQVRAGAAEKRRHRSRKHAEAARYLLGYPPPASLEACL